MNPSTPKLPNLVIAGTEKAGTTSVFTYLSAHPEVCGSAVKETDFFRFEYIGIPSLDAGRYASHFAHCNGTRKIYMEASPGYLGSGEEVAPRMRELVPAARVLFILRDPIDRLYSSFNFHLNKLDIPVGTTFEDYVDRCMAYDGGLKKPQDLGLEEWYLKVLGFGRYADFLRHYYMRFPSAQIRVMFYEDFNENVAGFMEELCEFVGISPAFFADYEFRKVNVTFSSRSKWLHRVAVDLNSLSERFLRQRPAVKNLLVQTYKKINQEREGYNAMSNATRQVLQAYYRPSVGELQRLLVDRRIPWSGY